MFPPELSFSFSLFLPKWDTPEFPPIRSEDNTKVDIALFAQGSTPSVFIETKALGKLASNLSNIERQVRDYNRNNTAPFSIITDGKMWRFYFSQTSGQFHEKFFKECDLIDDDLDVLEEILVLFLGKDNILNGRAEREALQYLQLTKLEKAAQDLLHQARQMIDVSPFPRLPEALANLMHQKGFNVSEVQATELLQRISKPQPSTVTLTSHQKPIKPPINYREALPVHSKISLLDPENFDDLHHTKVEGTIGGEQRTNWSKLIALGIALALNQGYSAVDLNDNLKVNVTEGKYTDNGYYYISDLNISVQRLDANGSCETLLQIAEMLQCDLELIVTWTKKSSRAGEKAMIRWP